MNVLQEADKLVSEERNARYGHPKNSFAQIGRMWSEILGIPISAEQVALMMAAMKLCRLIHRPNKRDSAVDLCGYIRTFEMVRDDQQIEDSICSPAAHVGKKS